MIWRRNTNLCTNKSSNHRNFLVLICRQILIVAKVLVILTDPCKTPIILKALIVTVRKVFMVATMTWCFVELAASVRRR